MPAPIQDENFWYHPYEGCTKYTIDYMCVYNSVWQKLNIPVWSKDECIVHELVIKWNRVCLSTKNHVLRRQHGLSAGNF